MSQIRHKYIDGLQKRIYYGYIKLLDNKKTIGDDLSNQNIG